MTKLRRKMMEDLQLAGMAEATQREYTRTVRQLAEHYMKSPVALIGRPAHRSFYIDR